MEYNRRDFLSFLDKASLGAMVISPFLVGCGNTSTHIAIEIHPRRFLRGWMNKLNRNEAMP